MRKITVILVIAATAMCAYGEPKTRKYDPSALAKAVAPFIDELTIAVAHVDLTRIDVDATIDSVTKLIGVRDAKSELIKKLSKDFLVALRKAGARDAFAVVSLADITTGEPILIIVPLVGKADQRAIRGLLYSGRADGPVSRPDNPPGRGHANTQVKVIGNAVIRCTYPVLKRVTKMKPHRRGELIKAFAAAGDSTAQVLILPAADNLRVIEDLMPKLPAEIGGGPSTVLTRGMLWAAMGINPPPKASLNLVIQSVDTNAAKAMAGFFKTILKTIAAHRELRKVLPQINKIFAALTPRVSGDRLILNLTTKEFNALVEGPIAKVIAFGAKSDRIHASRDKMFLIGRAVNKYKRKHKEAYPPDLRTMVGEKMLSSRTLINPVSRKPAYVYIRPPAGMTPKESARCVMTYEDPATHKSKRAWVLFADRNPRFITVDDKFTKMIKEAKDASKKAYPEKKKTSK
jgi:hypothetical protein